MTIKELCEIATKHHIENYDIEIRQLDNDGKFNYMGRLSTEDIFINDTSRTVILQGGQKW